MVGMQFVSSPLHKFLVAAFFAALLEAKTAQIGLNHGTGT